MELERSISSDSEFEDSRSQGSSHGLSKEDSQNSLIEGFDGSSSSSTAGSTSSTVSGNDVHGESPVMMIGGTKKTERRRSRSRSRQRIESEFVKKVDEIPIVHDTVEYMLSTYGLVKDSNPLLKQSLERTEDAALWMKQKTEDVMAVTRLNRPLKTLDNVAAKSLEKTGETWKTLATQFEANNRNAMARMKAIADGMKFGTEELQYQMLEGVQTVLDYIEEILEPVMARPSADSAKYSEDTALGTTLARMLDMTYRFNVGIAQKTFERTKELTDINVWASTLKKHLDPESIRARMMIIRQELWAPTGKKLRYMEKKELTALDRQFIATTRGMVAMTTYFTDTLRLLTTRSVQGTVDLITYSRDVMVQVFEARSIKDLAGIVLHETHRGVEIVQTTIKPLKNSSLLKMLLNWLEQQEKAMAL